KPGETPVEQVADERVLPKVDPSVLDLNVLEALRSVPGRNGPNLVPELVKAFCCEEPQRHAELERLAAGRESRALAHAAHAFAGSSAVIGAHNSRRALLALERAARGEDWDEVAQRLREVHEAGERLRAAFTSLEEIFW
ncbi:MAG TPA: Hpt domain-containing protein, partial [Opitutus sp.]|nr:Hpt domain-containing protein [Opitutus sp.]